MSTETGPVVGERRAVSHLLSFLAWLVVLVVIFPIFWMVLNSFKEEIDANASPKLFFDPTLDRFREKIATHEFPDKEKVTVSIGYTLFDRTLSLDELINQADNALYYAKSTTRDAVHSYQQLVEKGLIPVSSRPKSVQIETT